MIKNKPVSTYNKPFRLARSFFTISIIFVFLASLILVAVVTKEAERIITKRVEDDSVMLMESLSRQMYDKFLVRKFYEKDNVHIGNPTQRAELNDIVLTTTYGFDLEDVVLYDRSGKAIYSTNNSDTTLNTFSSNIDVYFEAMNKYHEHEKMLRENPELLKRKQNKHFKGRQAEIYFLRAKSSHIMVGEGYWLWKFFPRGKFVLKSFIVMDNYNHGEDSTGVLELTRDLSPEFQTIGRLQILGFSVAAFISVLLTLILRVIVGRGETVIKHKNKEREELLEELNHSKRLASLGSMVATVAHEIRNPLGIIHSTADFLSQELKDNENDLKLTKIIIEESDRLSEVVTDFLDFARPQTPQLEQLFVEDILEEILASLEVTLAQSCIEVKVEFLKNSPFIIGDFKMLYRSFLNIIMNSVQVMPEGGLLTVITRVNEDLNYLMVIIEDTGTGLHEDDLEQIFEPFYTTKTKGSGLGLLIVENTIKTHGGSIEVLSLNYDNDSDDEIFKSGLRTTIFLPL